MQAEGIRTGDRGLNNAWEALEDAVVDPDGQTVRVLVRTSDGRENPAHFAVGEQVPLEFGAGPQPRFPEGTPEYERYQASLKEELAKWVAGEGEYADPWS